MRDRITQLADTARLMNPAHRIAYATATLTVVAVAIVAHTALTHVVAGIPATLIGLIG